MATIAKLASGHVYVEFPDYEDFDEFEDFLAEEKDMESWRMDVAGAYRAGFLSDVSMAEAEELFREFEIYKQARAATK